MSLNVSLTPVLQRRSSLKHHTSPPPIRTSPKSLSSSGRSLLLAESFSEYHTTSAFLGRAASMAALCMEKSWLRELTRM